MLPALPTYPHPRTHPTHPAYPGRERPHLAGGVPQGVLELPLYSSTHNPPHPPTTPTNHPPINWVPLFPVCPQTWEKTVMIVSHDRNFLNTVTTQTIFLHRKRLWCAALTHPHSHACAYQTPTRRFACAAPPSNACPRASRALPCCAAPKGSGLGTHQRLRNHPLSSHRAIIAQSSPNDFPPAGTTADRTTRS